MSMHIYFYSLILILFIGMSASAQDASKLVAKGAVTEKDMKAIPPLQSGITAFLVALGTAGGAAIAAGIQEYFKSKLKRSYYLPPPIPPLDSRNSIMLLGVGRVGKTTLIQKIFEDPKANPYERTKAYGIYSKIVARDPGSPKVWMYISDYTGQNLGQLVSAFCLQQKRPYSPMSYGNINSLILMVDLFAKNEDIDPDPAPLGGPVNARVRVHLKQWSSLAIDAIFGLITEDTINYVCLFINKVDLMQDQTPQGCEKYVEDFSPLIDLLTEKARKQRPDLKVKVIVGSAQFGAGTTELRDDLRAASVPA